MCSVWSNLVATVYLSQLVCLVWLREDHWGVSSGGRSIFLGSLMPRDAQSTL
jgi:hypothetical protein